MGNEGEITLEEALKMLAAAKLQIAEQQQELKSKDAVISEKDLKISTQISLLNQKNKELEAEKKEKEELRIENLRLQEELSSQLTHRFCSHSEKADNQPFLFDFEDEDLIPSDSEIAETVAGEGPYKEIKVREYIRRKCGRKAIDDSTPTKQIYHDIPEEEKVCACGCRLKKVGENSTKRLRIIPAKMYAIEDIYPKYACPNCEGSGDEDNPVFRQAPAVKYIQLIYKKEEELIEMNLPPEELVSKRKELIKPIFDEFHKWLLEMEPKVPPTLKFGRAINYALSSWQHLLNYLDCPDLFVDNSIAERSIKPFVIDRKNWLFSGSEKGAESSCFLFTLIENAKYYHLDPYEYLRCVFDQSVNCQTKKDYEKLLPWNISISAFHEEGTWKNDA